MRPMPVRTAQKIYHEARRRAGVTRGRGIHTLRHCFATHYLEQGKDLETIRQMLGHRSLATTCRYLHMSPQSMQSNRSPLDALYDDH
jgi:site-specific recombinase XerD